MIKFLKNLKNIFVLVSGFVKFYTFNNKNKFVRQVPIVELFNLLFVIKLNPISQFVTTIYL